MAPWAAAGTAGSRSSSRRRPTSGSSCCTTICCRSRAPAGRGTPAPTPATPSRCRRAPGLVAGEHYPPVVRAAIAATERDDRVVAALMLGGTEKLRGEPDYGVPLEQAGDDAGAALVAAARRHAAQVVVDLSDEP